MQNEPFWLILARQFIGTREIPGAAHEAKIVKWWRAIRQTIADDETPWCAAFVGGVLEECGIQSSRSAAARSYTKWGRKLQGPAVGAVVSFWRGAPSGWSGHVGFVVGRDAKGNIMVLGGNQGDAVNIKPFAINRVLAYTWPSAFDTPVTIKFSDLPLLGSDGKVSTNEA